MAAKKCDKCEGTFITTGTDGLVPCPNLSVTVMGRLACKLPDGSISKSSSSVANARMQKDKAYEERNLVVSKLAECIIWFGGRAGRKKTKIEGWNPAWAWCVYIDLPKGGPQISWHYHTSHEHIFEWLPLYQGEWDGHDTPTKYIRLNEWQP